VAADELAAMLPDPMLPHQRAAARSPERPVPAIICQHASA
jgi:hypothetical protein